MFRAFAYYDKKATCGFLSSSFGKNRGTSKKTFPAYDRSAHTTCVKQLFVLFYLNLHNYIGLCCGAPPRQCWCWKPPPAWHQQQRLAYSSSSIPSVGTGDVRQKEKHQETSLQGRSASSESKRGVQGEQRCKVSYRRVWLVLSGNLGRQVNAAANHRVHGKKKRSPQALQYVIRHHCLR